MRKVGFVLEGFPRNEDDGRTIAEIILRG